MSNMIQPQWSVSSTVEGFLLIARGLFNASTSDNVSLPALVACQAFGNTLAMSQFACDRVETRVLPTPERATVNFLKVLVGYSKDDCAYSLGQSHNGIRFLALATALVSTMDLYKCAQCLSLMLESSTGESAWKPKVSELRDLLASLAPRCYNAGFYDDVLNWHQTLGNALAAVNHTPRAIRSSSLPAQEGIEKLIYAFRELRRVGSSTSSRILIRTFSSAPWIAAFTEWCLGEPPTIVTFDGKVVMSHPGSPVTITQLSNTDGTSPRLHISLIDTVSGPRELVSCDKPGGSYDGLVSLDGYVRWIRDTLGIESDDLKSRAVTQMLGPATRIVLERLDLIEGEDTWYQTKVSRNMQLAPSCDPSAVARMIKIFLKGNQTSADCLPDGMVLTDIPIVKQVMTNHYSTGRTTDFIVNAADLGNSDWILYDSNQRQGLPNFLKSLAEIIVHVMALSLFHHPADLRLQAPPRMHYEDDDPLLLAVWRILRSRSQERVSVTSLLKWSLSLVGHDMFGSQVVESLQEGTWIMSCQSGQAVWPVIFDMPFIQSYGYLGLASSTGRLSYKGETYDLVKADDLPTLVDPEGDDIAYPPVEGPCNLYPMHKMVWNLETSDRFILAHLGLVPPGRPNGIILVNPFFILRNLASAILVDACCHSPDARLDTADTFTQFTGPLRGHGAYGAWESPGHDGRVTVLAVDKNNGLRMFSSACLGNHQRIVLRKSACLSCCLDVCRLSGRGILIL